MHIGFIEDTHLHGGTQIWVTEAVQVFIERNHEVSLLAPEGSWMVEQCRNTGAIITTYDWDEVVQEDPSIRKSGPMPLANVTWRFARSTRRGKVSTARYLQPAVSKIGNLETHLIPKTGTIVPEYLREFYLPDETINSSVIAITDFTRNT